MIKVSSADRLSTRTFISLVGLAALAGVLLLTACAPSPAAAPAATSAPPPAGTPAAKPTSEPTKPAAAAPKADPSQELQRVYEAAKKEGEIVWHLSTPSLEALVAPFTKRYPGIKVSTFVKTSPELVPQIVTEASAQKIGTDVAMMTVGNALPLMDRNLIPVTDWRALGVDPGDILLDGKMLTVYEVVYGFVYNSQLVSAADAPRTFEDLLGPKWSGQKMVINSSGSAVAILYFTRDQAQVDAYLVKLRAQSPVMEASSFAVLPKIDNAEAPLGDALLTDVPRLKAQGSKLEVAAIGPNVVDPFAVGTFAGSPHPNGARLLMAWLASAEGKAEFAKLGRGKATPCDASDLSKLVCQYKLDLFSIATAEKSKLSSDYKKRAQQILLGQ